jgi:hypothetical protein
MSDYEADIRITPEPESIALDYLEKNLDTVLDLIERQPCHCEAWKGGVTVCRRCLLVGRK